MRDLKKNYLNIPNTITLFRILLVIPFFILFLRGNYISSIIILLMSGLSDLLDGIAARNLNQVTKLGKILDPIADKLTLIAVVICMGIKFSAIMPIAILFIVKDASMLIAGLMLIKKGIDPPAARWYGKLATCGFYVSVITIVMLDTFFGIYSTILSLVLLLITAGFMIFAFIKYFILFLNLIKKK
ncbi:MAG: putative cardiolipin synthase [Eubacteriales bacterium SKADARSKE-1]|nr:putative cardiolipin synthase [Eubacteriales bacterium SKADARSKE-1]